MQPFFYSLCLGNDKKTVKETYSDDLVQIRWSIKYNLTVSDYAEIT